MAPGNDSTAGMKKGHDANTQRTAGRGLCLKAEACKIRRVVILRRRHFIKSVMMIRKVLLAIAAAILTNSAAAETIDFESQDGGYGYSTYSFRACLKRV
jgi:hypothetical protein